MPKGTGFPAAFYIDGTDVSGDIQSLGKIGGGPAALDMTAINNSAFARQGGVRDGGMDFVSYFNPGAGLTHAKLSALPAADVICSYFNQPAIGSDAASCVAKQVNYDPTRGTDGSLTFAVQALANGFGLEWGTQLTPGRRVDGAATAAGPANSFDTGASAAFGAQAYFHLFAFTGTSVTISVWDSADNITFAAVASLTTTALTVPGAVRVAISNAATVRRYVAVATVGTFTVADFAVSLHKNEIAGVVF
jgi:hypothetical protein